MYINKFYWRPTGDDEEDEIEQNITDISSMVSNLKHMAVDIGNEVDTQNQQLEKIYEEVKKLHYVIFNK